MRFFSRCKFKLVCWNVAEFYRYESCLPCVGNCSSFVRFGFCVSALCTLQICCNVRWTVRVFAFECPVAWRWTEFSNRVAYNGSGLAVSSGTPWFVSLNLLQKLIKDILLKICSPAAIAASPCYQPCAWVARKLPIKARIWGFEKLCVCNEAKQTFSKAHMSAEWKPEHKKRGFTTRTKPWNPWPSVSRVNWKKNCKPEIHSNLFGGTKRQVSTGKPGHWGQKLK